MNGYNVHKYVLAELELRPEHPYPIPDEKLKGRQQNTTVDVVVVIADIVVIVVT